MPNSKTYDVTGCGEDKMKDEAVEFTKEAILKKLADPESASFSRRIAKATT